MYNKHVRFKRDGVVGDGGASVARVPASVGAEHLLVGVMWPRCWWGAGAAAAAAAV